MTFSILIPVYKAEKYLAETVSSVLRQKGDFEIVLVEDGSPDRSGEICDQLAAAHPGVIRAVHEPHRGTVATRRAAVREARGDYLVWLDADDVLVENALEVLSAALESDPKPDAVLYDLSFFFEDGRPDVIRPAIFPERKLVSGEGKKEIWEMLIGTNLLDGLVLKMIRADLMKNDPTDYTALMDNPYSEDVCHCLWPLTEAENILLLPEVLYRYRIHDGSVMHVFNEQTMDKRFNTARLALFEEFLARWGLDDDEHRAKLKANAYKSIVNDVLYFLEQGEDKAKIGAFVSRFNAEHPELKEIAAKPFLGTRQRVILKLFSQGRTGLLVLMNKVWQKLRH